jgi:hypothetical protein
VRTCLFNGTDVFSHDTNGPSSCSGKAMPVVIWFAPGHHLGMIGVIRPRSFGRWIAPLSCDAIDAVLFYANKSVFSDIADHPSVDTFLYNHLYIQVCITNVPGLPDTSYTESLSGWATFQRGPLYSGTCRGKRQRGVRVFCLIFSRHGHANLHVEVGEA